MTIQELYIEKEKIDEAAFVVRLRGALCAATYEKFMKDIQYALRKGGVILDMEEVWLISSRGLTALKEIYDYSYRNGRKIVLLNLSPHANQVLHIMELRKIFNIAANEELAMKMVTK